MDSTIPYYQLEENHLFLYRDNFFVLRYGVRWDGSARYEKWKVIQAYFYGNPSTEEDYGCWNNNFD